MTIKIALRPGESLAEGYANRRDNYKVVETEYALGYVVSGGGRESAAAIYPIYRATIHTKVGKTWHVVSSYEQGPRLNAFSFQEDLEGCALASIAAQAVGALVERQRIAAQAVGALVERQRARDRAQKRSKVLAKKKRVRRRS